MNLIPLLFSFEGRIGRQSFWIVLLGLLALHGLLEGLTPVVANPADAESAMSATQLLFILLTLWIQLAVQIKRWHDLDKSGWWALIGLVPVIGPLWILLECGLLRGTQGENRFGPDPLQQHDARFRGMLQE